MAKVNPVTLCPGCGAEIPFPTPEQCACGFVFLSPDGSPFTRPAYISTQFTKLENELAESRKRQQEVDKQRADLIRHKRLWFRTCSDQDRLAALVDTMEVLQALLHSRVLPENAKKIVKVGKRIGALAEAIDNYVACGGVLHGLPTTPRSEDSESDLESLK